MTAAYQPSSSTALSVRGSSSAGPVHDAHDRPRLPNTNDIDDLIRQVQQTIDALWCLLVTEKKWKKSLSSEHRQLLESSGVQFCTFCEEVSALLDTFYHFSALFATLLKSTRESHPSAAQFARSLCSETDDICARITSIVEGSLREFTCNFKKVLLVAPKIYLSDPRYSTNLPEVFQRLDVFWKVIITYLDSVLQRRSKSPPLGIILDAEKRWMNYGIYHQGANAALAKSSDALRAATDACALKRRGLMSLLRTRLFGKVMLWFRNSGG